MASFSPCQAQGLALMDHQHTVPPGHYYYPPPENNPTSSPQPGHYYYPPPPENNPANPPQPQPVASSPEGHTQYPYQPPYQAPPPSQQRLSLASLSGAGKKTSSWLKKNVTPRIDNVARSSLVQGGVQGLSNAYTAAKGMRDEYSARHSAVPQAPPTPSYPTSHTTATVAPPTWDHGQTSYYGYPPPEPVQLSHDQPQPPSQPTISRKPVPVVQTQPIAEPPSGALSNSGSFLLPVRREPNKTMRVIPGPNGEETFVLEDLLPGVQVADTSGGYILSIVPELGSAIWVKPCPGGDDYVRINFTMSHVQTAVNTSPTHLSDQLPEGYPRESSFSNDDSIHHRPYATEDLTSAISQIQLTEPIQATATRELGETVDIAYEPLVLKEPLCRAATTEGPLRVCPQTRVVTYKTTWYHLRGQPDFSICSWCFHKHVAPSALREEFESVIRSDVSCRFNTSRVTRTLWPEAMVSGVVDSLRDFITRRVQIPPCKGTDGALGTDGIKFFGLATGIPGMGICEACYEDNVLGTCFANRFIPAEQKQGDSERWVCALSHPYIQRALIIKSQSTDHDAAWAEFEAAANRRLALPACEISAVQATRCNWYRPKTTAVENVDFCEACFLDHLGMTPLGDNHFAETGEDFMQKLCMRSCDMRLLSVRECIHVCRTKGLGIDTLLAALGKIASSPRCIQGAAIPEGKFYNFVATSNSEGGARNYGVCEGCHAGILGPHGMQDFYSQEPQLVPGEAMCAFNPSVARFRKMTDKWCQAVETGAWGAYEDWVRAFAPVPECPNFNLAAGRQWYGWEDCPICADCFAAVAKDTALVGQMPLHDTLIQQETLCALYSDRMRALYRAACDSGDATDLRAASRRRWETYQVTVPRFKMIAEMQSMQQQLAMSKMMMGLSYQHANAMSDWVSPSQQEYSDGSGNYYSSQYGVDGAKAFNEGSAELARAQGPLAEASYLKDVWTAVE